MFLLFCLSFPKARDCCPFGLVYFPKVIPIYFHYCFSRYLSVIRWVLSSIDWSVHRSLLNIFESLAKFALLPLPNHPRDCLAVLPALFLVNICFCLKKKKKHRLTWQNLANKLPCMVTWNVVPSFAAFLLGAVFPPSSIIGFMSCPIWISNSFSVGRLPVALIPLVSQSDPTLLHESSNHVSCLLVPNDGQVAAVSLANPLRIVPRLFLCKGLVEEAIFALGISTWRGCDTLVEKKKLFLHTSIVNTSLQIASWTESFV